ncbi:MAG: pantothenate synthetase [Actinomycetota bacterium]
MFEMDRGQTMTTLFTDLQQFSNWRRGILEGETVGFVPTMGALHQGHASLMQRARRECDRVVVSIYVNSLQFNSANDFSNYPRTAEADFELCKSAEVDVVLSPLKSEMFPRDVVGLIAPSKDAQDFEGADRPGHFSGVVTVVDRLFSIVQPSVAYFGLKDYQQVAVISKMSEHLHPHIDIQPCETIREADGLAMSSRNRLMSSSARASATLIPLALRTAITYWQNGFTDSTEVANAAREVLHSDQNIDIQYVAIVAAGTMNEVHTIKNQDVIIVAVVIDGIRLIDNMQFSNV